MLFKINNIVIIKLPLKYSFTVEKQLYTKIKIDSNTVVLDNYKKKFISSK